MRTHDLKIWPTHFEDLLAGLKTVELRYDDRGFQPGDRLLLREWDRHARAYTGREMEREVSLVTPYTPPKRSIWAKVGSISISQSMGFQPNLAKWVAAASLARSRLSPFAQRLTQAPPRSFASAFSGVGTAFM